MAVLILTYLSWLAHWLTMLGERRGWLGYESWGMQPLHLVVYDWPMARAGRAPVMKTRRVGKSVCKAVGNGKPSAALQLSQHNYHLPETFTKCYNK